MFIYICPPKTPVKLKMVYSAAKASVVAFVQDVKSITISQKYEMDDTAELYLELKESSSREALNKSTGSMKPKFAKPTRPGKN